MTAEKYRAQMRSEEEANTSREKLFPDAVAALCKMRQSAGVEESGPGGPIRSSGATPLMPLACASKAGRRVRSSRHAAWNSMAMSCSAGSAVEPCCKAVMDAGELVRMISEVAGRSLSRDAAWKPRRMASACRWVAS